MSSESESTDTESEEKNEEKEDTDEEDNSSESEESKSSEEENDEESEDDSSSDESEEGRKPSKVITEEKESQTEFKPEYKDISCGSEIVTNSQESQTDNAVPVLPAPVDLHVRNMESMTDVQLGPSESYVPFPKPEQKDSTTWTDVSISNREVQTDEILFPSPKSASEVINSEIDRVPSSLNKEESPLLTNVHVSPIKNSGQDRGVQADIALKSRRVRTQTKVKRHDVQTLTSGLIKRVNMQTYTSGLVSKSDHSTNTVDMKNTVNIKMKNRKTQTEDYISGTINEKHGEENGTSTNTSQKSYRVPNLTDVSPESAASHRASGGKQVERKIQKSNTKEPCQPRDKIQYKRSESISKQNSGDGEEEKKQRNKAFKQDSGSEEEEKQTVKPSEQDPGSGKEKKKTDKEKENFHRRRRRRRELYFLPIRHPSSDSKSSNQKRSRKRPKSSGSLPKRKSMEHGNARPLSCAQYRMLYHHRWAEIPF